MVRTARHLCLVFIADRVQNYSQKRGQMLKKIKSENQCGVDKGLVAMFLRMSPEERLLANDNALRAILELRHAFRQRKSNDRKSKRNS